MANHVLFMVAHPLHLIMACVKVMVLHQRDGQLLAQSMYDVKSIKDMATPSILLSLNALLTYVQFCMLMTLISCFWAVPCPQTQLLMC